MKKVKKLFYTLVIVAAIVLIFFVILGEQESRVGSSDKVIEPIVKQIVDDQDSSVRSP